jgi:hypothetical protein
MNRIHGSAGVRLTGWRKIANALWNAPRDPQIFGSLEIDATPALAFIEVARSKGHHVTATHLVGRAIARALWSAIERTHATVSTSSSSRA